MSVPKAIKRKACSAGRYSGPNNKFKNTPGKSMISINMGILMISIHFPTCLLNSLISFTFFLEYSLAINGKNNCINISGAKPRRPAIGIAALYIPTQEASWKYPMKNESIQTKIEERMA